MCVRLGALKEMHRSVAYHRIESPLGAAFEIVLMAGGRATLEDINEIAGSLGFEHEDATVCLEEWLDLEVVTVLSGRYVVEPWARPAHIMHGVRSKS